jgi:hypothetical protein
VPSLYTATRRKRISALLLAACMVSVWLLGARAALSTSIYAAKHACCHQQQLADSCVTLCASANWTATASVEQAPLAPAFSVAWIEAPAPIRLRSDAFVRISAVNHSPPLYLQHSSLLI